MSSLHKLVPRSLRTRALALHSNPSLHGQLRGARGKGVLAVSENMAKVPRTTLKYQTANQGKSFKVLQWNVLADGLAQNGDFVKVQPHLLDWEYRFPLILEEVLESAADILCFQELNHFDGLLEHLAVHSYAGQFMAKQSSVCGQYGFPSDGCAIFYNKERFEELSHITGQPYVDDRGKPQAQGFLHVLLRDKATGRQLQVATTHLKAKHGDKLDAVRLSQAQQLLSWLHNALNAVPAPCLATSGTDPYERPAVLVCGDFNSTPDSPACQAMKSHPLGLSCMWDAMPSEAGVPEFSTWKYRTDVEVKRIIDYVYFSGDGRLRPVSRWQMLNEVDVGPEALPCPTYPSDHVALCCELAWPPAVVAPSS